MSESDFRFDPAAGDGREPTIRLAPVVVGDAAVARFPDGAVALGGNGLLVAWHLEGFGLAPLLVARVGGDARGTAILDAMDAWGLDRRGIQRDERRRTRVDGPWPAGPPGPRARHRSAADFLAATAARRALGGVAARWIYATPWTAHSEAGLRTVAAILAAGRAPLFADLGADLDSGAERPDERARWLLAQAGRARVSSSLLPALAGPAATRGSSRDRRALAVAACRAWDLDLLVVEGRGGDRLLAGGAGECVGVRGPLPGSVEDPAGAGAAFVAALLHGADLGWPLADLASRAQGFAALIAAQTGPASPAGAVYRAAVERWRDGPPGPASPPPTVVRASEPLPRAERVARAAVAAVRDRRSAGSDPC